MSMFEAAETTTTTEAPATSGMKMQQRRYDFLLEARTPIAHHAESLGNTAIIMRRKVRLPDGGWAHVPVVTADTMRHGLRESGAYALLDAAGLLESPALGEAALRLLFAGGMMSGRGDAGVVKLDQFREMSELLPTLALLGGCASNRVIPGRLVVDDAVLVCEETLHLFPEWVGQHLEEMKIGVSTAREHVEEEQRVRMDPTLDPGKRKLLTAGSAEVVQQRLLASEAGHEAADEVAMDGEKSSMMPRRFERVASGSLFFWSVTATTYSDLDLDTFNTMVAAFLSNARVGGKKGTGHGLMRPVVAKHVQLARPRETPAALDANAIAPRLGSLFLAHVSLRKDRLAAFLRTVDA